MSSEKHFSPPEPQEYFFDIQPPAPVATFLLQPLDRFAPLRSGPPGPEVHQEHLEPGERYEEVARTTRRILGIARRTAEETAAQCAIRILDRANIHRAKLARIRDLMMPVWAEFYYELVFGEQCPPAARELIVGNANDVVTALKCCSLRHMDKRHRLTRFLIEKIWAGKVAHLLPRQLSVEEQAFYLQGTYFNTAVVQMSGRASRPPPLRMTIRTADRWLRPG